MIDLRISVALITGLTITIGSSHALARDVFVTVGGGPEPQNNQVSLEKNVEFFARTLDRHYPQPLDHRILFADGSASQPDLQFIDDNAEISPAMRWMTRIIGEEHWIPLRYRNHHPLGDNRPASKEHFQELLQSLADELIAGDRLVLYVTAHGSHADTVTYQDENGLSSQSSEHARDTSIVLWGGDELRASEFTDWLDQFHPDVEIIVVMVQCYSGGFAEIVFREGHRKFGLSQRRRCGFFSQRHDRASAGCTPDVDESDYQEYSSFFWAALSRQSRDGTTVIDADYDQDGKVSLAEAHAYAIITSDTIDVPVKTSDVVLRRYSRIATDDDETTESPGVVSSIFGSLLGREHANESSETYSIDRSIEDVVKIARPEQRLVVTHLSSMLEVSPESTVRSVQRMARRLTDRIDRQYATIAELTESETTLIQEVRRSLNEANPEFRQQGFSPIIAQWVTDRSNEFVSLIESFQESQALVHVQDELQSLRESVDQVERREAKLVRLVATLQNILLEANLDNVADVETIEYYERLVELENAVLWPSSYGR